MLLTAAVASQGWDSVLLVGLSYGGSLVLRLASVKQVILLTSLVCLAWLLTDFL